MSSLPRIDIHCHAFHPKIASKVCEQLQDYYQMKASGTALWEDLEPRLRQAHIQYATVLSAATRKEQVEPANHYAVTQVNFPGAIPFGTIHPDYEKIEEMLAYLWDNGIRGIKLHPDFQGFRLDDPRMDRVYAACEGRFVVLSHVGDRFPPEVNPSCPYKIAAIKRKYPKLQLVAAHFGGYRHWEHVVKAYEGVEIYMDTSSALFAIPQELLEQIFKAFPRERFFFGSDYPLGDCNHEIELLQRRLRLTDTEIDQLMTNANVLNLTEGRKPLDD
ncbi:MAG: amidohydrolase [Lentisphaeria bacterium]|nr:amidohydrolase [Lentisphaeria bacterium]